MTQSEIVFVIFFLLKGCKIIRGGGSKIFLTTTSKLVYIIYLVWQINRNAQKNEKRKFFYYNFLRNRNLCFSLSIFTVKYYHKLISWRVGIL